MKQFLYAFAGGCIVGIIFTEVTNQSYSITYALLLIICVIFIACSVDSRMRTRYVTVCLLISIGMCVGVMRTLYAYEMLPSPIFHQHLGKTTFDAHIVSSIDSRDVHSTFTIRPHIENVKIEAPLIRVRVPRINTYAYGDSLRLTGALKII